VQELKDVMEVGLRHISKGYDIVRPFEPRWDRKKFVGREQELDYISHRLNDSDMVTVVIGPQQTGKTTLIEYLLATKPTVYLDLRANLVNNFCTLDHFVRVLRSLWKIDGLEEYLRKSGALSEYRGTLSRVAQGITLLTLLTKFRYKGRDDFAAFYICSFRYNYIVNNFGYAAIFLYRRSKCN
jgi:hypothetical protein